MGEGGESGWGLLKHLSSSSPSHPAPPQAACPPILSGKSPLSPSPNSELSHPPWTTPARGPGSLSEAAIFQWERRPPGIRATGSAAWSTTEGWALPRPLMGAFE